MTVHIRNAEEITEENHMYVVSALLQEQFRYTAEQLQSDAEYWSAWFISDDGTDYTTTALDACSKLMYLRYEGTLADLREWLFTPRSQSHDSLSAIDSAGGLCNSLQRISEAVTDKDED